MRAYSVIILTSLAGILILLFFTAWFNRPSADDFAYLADIRQMGIWNTATFSFQTWNTRFTSILTAATGLWIYELSGTFLMEQAAAYMFLVFGIFRIIDLKAANNISLLDKATLTAVLFLAFFFITPSVSETWIWHISYSMYFLPLLACVWLLFFMLRQAEGIFYKILVSVLLTYLFMASEFWSILMIGVFSFLLYKNDVFAQKNRRFIILSIAVLTSGLLIMKLGQGTALRTAQLPNFEMDAFLYSWFRGTASTVFKYICVKLPLICCLAIPFLVLGKASASSGLNLKKNAFKAFIAWFTFVLLNHAVLAYTMQEAGPLRARAVSAFAFIIFIFYVFWLLGLGLKKKNLQFQKWIWMPAIVILLVSISANIIALPKHKNYAKAYDARIKLLQELNKSEGITEVQLDPLPDSGLIYSNDIQFDETDYRNKALRRYLKLNFPVGLKPTNLEQPS